MSRNKKFTFAISSTDEFLLGLALASSYALKGVSFYAMNLIAYAKYSSSSPPPFSFSSSSSSYSFLLLFFLFFCFLFLFLFFFLLLFVFPFVLVLFLFFFFFRFLFFSASFSLFQWNVTTNPAPILHTRWFCHWIRRHGISLFHIHSELRMWTCSDEQQRGRIKRRRPAAMSVTAQLTR